MLRIFANSVDITGYVQYGSVKIKEQLNNRSNSLDFVTLDKKVNENEEVLVYECMQLTAQAVSGQPTISVDDTYEYYEIFRIGDQIILDFEGVNEKVTILSIDHTLKTVTFTANLVATHNKDVFVGRRIFGGSVTKNPDGQIGFSEQLEYKVSCNDYSTVINRQVVVETFQDQYMRQIFGLIVYEFCANDDEVTLDLFESAWTQGGVGLAMADDTTDMIQGSKCQKTGTSGAGTATWTKTLGAPVDISAMDDIRLWHKTGENNGVKVTSLKYRVGNDSSNYHEWTSVRVGVENEDCRNFENFKMDNIGSTTGTVDETQIDRLQIEVVASDTIVTGNLKFDHSLATASGITLKNCIRGDRKFSDVRAQYKKPAVLIEDICKIQLFGWYVDYYRDLNVFRSNATPAPFELTDTSENFDDLNVTVDISMLRNRQTVRGGEAPMTTRYVQDEYCDGLMDSWSLSYGPKDLLVYLATQDTAITGITWLAGVATVTAAGHGLVDGDDVAITDVIPNGYNGSYTIHDMVGNTFQVDIAVDPGAYSSGGFVGKFLSKTVGIENIDDPTAFEFLFNFNAKIVRLGSAGIPKKGTVIRRDYFPYQPIRVRCSAPVSIAAMKAVAGGDGIFDGALITDNSILTFADARARAYAELNAYSNPIISATFNTEKAGLKAGQVIHIVDATRSLDNTFLIQTVQRKSKKGAIATYDVSCGSTMFGLTEFFQFLLKKASTMEIDVSEMVDIVINQDETISISAVVTTDKRSSSYAGLLTKKWDDFTRNAGTKTSGQGVIPHTDSTKKNMWNAEISTGVTATVGFAAASNYNTTKGLYIDIDSYVGSPTGLFAKAYACPIKVSPSQAYTFGVWIENLIADGITGGSGLTIQIKEYALRNGTTALQTTSVVTSWNTKQDASHISANFTTNASTNYIKILITLLESTGKVTIPEMYLSEVGTETVTDPGVVDFCEAVAA